MFDEILKKWKNTPTNDLLMHKHLKKLARKGDYRLFKKAMHLQNSALFGARGAGYKMINVHTISAAAFAYAQYLMKLPEAGAKSGIIIARDNNAISQYYAEEVARVLLFLKIPVFMFDESVSVPLALLSYTVKKMDVWGGIMIGSRDNNQTNGIIFLGEFGQKLTFEKTRLVDNIYQYIDPLNVVQVASLAPVVQISDQIVGAYFQQLAHLIVRPNDASQITLQYFSTNHSNTRLALELMHNLNFDAKASVQHNWVQKSKLLMTQSQPDLLIKSDSNGESFELLVLHNYQYRRFNYNDLAIMLSDYIIHNSPATAARGTTFYGTHFTSAILQQVAKRAHLNYETNFRDMNAIAQTMLNTKNALLTFSHENKFIFNHAITSTNDNFQTMIMLLNLANYLKTQGKTLIDYQRKMYKSYGYYTNTRLKVTMNFKNIQKLSVILYKLEFIANQQIVRRTKNSTKKSQFLKLTFGEENSSFILHIDQNELLIDLEVISSFQKHANSLTKMVLKELKWKIRQVQNRLK